MNTLIFVLIALFALVTVNAGPADWKKQLRSDPNTQITLTFGLRQQNIDQIERILYEVSDPRSSKYGQHLSHSAVQSLTAPTTANVNALLAYLRSFGLDTEKATHTPNYSWLSITTTVSIAERMLNTKYHDYTHIETGRILSRSEPISLPPQISAAVDVVGPTTRFPFKTSVKVRKIELDGRTREVAPNAPCSGGVTPDCLRSVYNIGNATAMSNMTQVAVTGYLEQYISPQDLALFFSKYDNASVGRTAGIYGPNDATQPGDEASLDIQYSMGVGHGVNGSFWYTPGRSPKNPENEPFLVFLQDLDKISTPPQVISTSYGDDEYSVDLDYGTRVNQEFAKSGTRGITTLFSSGDSGAGCDSTGKVFDPTFPGASPFVTAVGATYHQNPEEAVEFSSGGFSNYWARPAYQTQAVSDYFTKHAVHLPPKSYYNQTGRGFPDIAAQGVDFPIILGQSTEFVSGTSCSSPTTAGIFALLNDIRLSAGKSTLGFLNPIIYMHPELFNDITLGNGPGCDTDGWYACTGWDPITGMGTPDYAKWAAFVKSLP